MAQTITSIPDLVVEAKQVFLREFGVNADIAVFAPGRVNLIGEHTDYNDGFVMPMVSLVQYWDLQFLFIFSFDINFNTRADKLNGLYTYLLPPAFVINQPINP